MTSSSLQLSNQLLVGEVLKRASHRTPNQEAFVFEDVRLTHQELDDCCSKIAGWLQEQGIKKNDKVGFILKNSIEFVELLYGIALSGGVTVPVNYRLSADEVAYVVNNSDTKILFVESEFVELIKNVQSKIPSVQQIIVIGDGDSSFKNYQEIFDSKSEYLPCEDLTDNDPFLLLYTSGTTGKPKGAVLTHKNICQGVQNLIWESSARPHQRQLVAIPLFHIGGITSTVMTCLLNGTTFIHRDFNPVNILETIEKERINSFGLVPTMWNLLVNTPNIEDYDLTSVEKCTSGGSVASLSLKNKILKYFPNANLIDTLGQTETSQSATFLTGENVLKKPTSVGKSVINVEIRVVDENMKDVPIGEVGEIVYRGPTIMKEYYNNPEATKEAFEGGWFHSGDLVKMDEDGFIYVVDRKKHMIISGGENIYPAEIEEVLYQIPEVLECAVIGVPDEVWGENVKAFIVLKSGKSLTSEQVINYCKEHLASYKKPKSVEFVKELPKNAAGKILKNVLREREIEKV